MVTTVETVTTTKTLEYLPVGFFGSTMGLTGLSVAWRQANQVFNMPLWASKVIAVTAVVVFLALLAAYSVKATCAPDKVLAEFRHPIAGNLFGTFLISVLLLPIVIAPVNLPIARLMWCAGSVGMVVFAWTICPGYVDDRRTPGAHAHRRGARRIEDPEHLSRSDCHDGSHRP